MASDRRIGNKKHKLVSIIFLMSRKNKPSGSLETFSASIANMLGIRFPEPLNNYIDLIYTLVQT